ncbi:MAG: hypothetical protein B0D92_01795 [Spirochaeta sp. LUC14_002_19_P3]|nr:MAG: hypothetical protein B0D92_01795 [Spirochaeta sp. LUC14_002_19_P3]
MVNCLRPKSLDEALAFRAETKALPFAGGTDLMVKHRGYSGTGPRFDRPVLFLDALESLRTISLSNGLIRIGAALPLADILAFSGLPELLRRSLSSIAAPGLRNRASLGGNIANASPAGDSLPPLYVHEALLVLKSLRGERQVPIDKFFTGPGASVLAEDEILSEIQVPLLGQGLVYYRKVGTRKANALSKISAAGYALTQNGKLTDFRFAVGAVAPTVIRLKKAEEMLLAGTAEAALQAAAEYLRPIDDQRSTAAYRTQTALNSLKEFMGMHPQLKSIKMK